MKNKLKEITISDCIKKTKDYIAEIQDSQRYYMNIFDNLIKLKKIVNKNANSKLIELEKQIDMTSDLHRQTFISEQYFECVLKHLKTITTVETETEKIIVDSFDNIDDLFDDD